MMVMVEVVCEQPRFSETGYSVSAWRIDARARFLVLCEKFIAKAADNRIREVIAERASL